MGTITSRYLPGQFAKRLGTSIVALVALGAAGCGSDAPIADPNLSAAGRRGFEVARQEGCAACHGTRGEGQVGPAFVGLYGSEVTLDDGTRVVADDSYLRNSITDPGLQRVEGFRIPMPETNLSGEQIADLIAYIADLAKPAEPAGVTSRTTAEPASPADPVEPAGVTSPTTVGAGG